MRYYLLERYSYNCSYEKILDIYYVSNSKLYMVAFYHRELNCIKRNGDEKNSVLWNYSI